MYDTENSIALPPVVGVVSLVLAICVLEAPVEAQGVVVSILMPPYTVFTETGQHTDEQESETKDEDDISEEIVDDLSLYDEVGNKTVHDEEMNDDIIAFVAQKEFFNEEQPEAELWLVSDYVELLPDEQFYMLRLFMENDESNDTIILEEKSI